MKFLLFPVLFVCSAALAQDSLFTKLIPRHSIKFSPTHLIAFYPTFQLGYEARVTNRFSVQVEGGYVLDYGFNDNEDYQNKRGAKTKLELHYYMLPSARAKLVYYGAVEFYWNAVNFDRRNTQQECFDVECNHLYTRQFTYTVKYREPGFAFKMGFVKYFSRFSMDVNSGWALRFIDYTDPNANNFTEDFIAWDFEPNEEDRIALRPVIGFRLGYRLR